MTNTYAFTNIPLNIKKKLAYIWDRLLSITELLD